MTKLKQVCNHPAHLLKDGSRLPGRSGKLARLEELTEEIVEDGDKALVFTQYAEFGALLQPYLAAHLDRPTHLVLDLDPPDGAGFAAAVAAAHLVRRALADVGLAGAVKSSGAKGVHVLVPLAPGASVTDVAAATRAIAARAERLDPQLTTTAFVVEERGGKVFLDATRAGGATVAAAYSPRARAGVPVSLPLPWDELADASPADLTIRTVLDRIGDADPWSDLMPAPQALDRGLVEEGHTIPVARVAAMHEGKRRAKARRDAEQQDG